MNTISTAFDDGIFTLTLNRPEQGNAINLALADELLQSVEAAASDPAVRCVVLTGAGRMFCAGGDVGGFAEAGGKAGPFLKQLADTLHNSVMLLATMPKPLVALVNGPAAGAGFSLAAAADIVLASDAAHFTAAYAAIGLTPDGGMSWFLPRLIGMRRAQELILTNRRLPAQEAAQIGLITRVVTADDLIAEGMDVARRLADGPTSALGVARRLLVDGQTTALREQLDKEAALIADAVTGAEAQEGIAAFGARRRPNFADPGLKA